MFGLHVYYYVPPCPNCGQDQTGRYVKEPLYDKGLTTEESLRHGEIVREIDRVPEKNCFCEVCGFEWHAYISSSLISTERLSLEKKKRQTTERYSAYMAERYPFGKKRRTLFQRLFF